MARSKGSANLAASLEVLAGAPLDARLVVGEKADLTASGTFPYSYVGMPVVCKADNKIYLLIGSDPTVLANWKEVGSDVDLSNYYTKAEVNNLVETAENGRFEVVEQLPTEDIKTNVIYLVPKSSAGQDDGYDEWINTDATTLGWEHIGTTDIDLTGYVQHYTTMPTADATYLGMIVQYVGATSTYTKGYWYECVSDGATPPVYTWEQRNVQPSDSGSGNLTRAITTAITVGGIASGTTYAVDTPIENILSDMLEPTLYPTFTAPSASLSYGASQYYAVGSSVSAMTGTVSLNRGTINPAYGTSGYRAGAATGFAIETNGADTEFSDSDTSSGAFSVPALTKSTKGTIVVTGTVSYAAGEQPKDSKGGNYSSALSAGSVTATKTLTFIQPYYYGISNASTISDLTGLTANVTAKSQKTFSFTTNNQYMVFAYDSSYGNLTSILDSNGFETISGWTKNQLVIDGFTYFYYISNSPTTDTNAAFTFKY